MTDTTENKNTIGLYALFGVTIILTLLPNAAALFASLVMAIILIFMAYKNRGPKDVSDKNFDEKHASYILRSIAGVSILMSITLTFGIIYILGNIDYTAFDSCAQNLAALGGNPAAVSNEAVLKLAQPCMANFIESNKSALIISMIITAGLPLLYIGWRLIYGLSRALKNQAIENPYKWV